MNRDHNGLEITNTPCHCCGRGVRKMPRWGKRYYRHKCPHGRLCAASRAHTNYPQCSECLKTHRERHEHLRELSRQ